MSAARLTRRGLLGAAAGLVGSTFLPRAAWADNTPPKRLIIVFSANGTIYDQWRPTGTEKAWTLSTILQPLAPYKDRVNVYDGINVEVASDGPGDDHMKGMGCMLTGVQLLPGTTQGGAGTPAGFASGISIDQQIANAIGTTTTYKSLEFGAYVENADVWSRMIYAGSNQPLPPMEDPVATFKRLFSGSGLNPTQLARLLKRRQSALDHVQTTLTDLSGKVGADDRLRVQAHLDSVRQIEKQILSQTAACTPPAMGSPLDLSDINNYPAVAKLQMDMLVASLACDTTRVASMQFSHSVSDIPMPWLGISDGHHTLSHMGDSDTASQNKLVQINTWYAQQIAYLCSKLDAVTESNGTLLDNSMVVWVNELAKGNVHSHNPLPVVIIGKGGGAMNTGRYVQYGTAQSHQNLLVSIANAMGVSITTFGDPTHCTGPLTNF